MWKIFKVELLLLFMLFNDSKVVKLNKIEYNRYMMDMAWIISKIKEDDYLLSEHADDERINDNLMLYEIEESVLNGLILESYPNDSRGSSCLVVGFTKVGKPIHVVCGKNGNLLIVITVYIPAPPKFKNPYQRSHK